MSNFDGFCGVGDIEGSVRGQEKVLPKDCRPGDSWSSAEASTNTKGRGERLLGRKMGKKKEG